MTIAQHSVAGEECIRHHETDASNSTVLVKPDVQLFAPQRRNLPNRILRALDAAKHIDGLAKNLRAALAELVRYVPQAEPFATIFAHKTSIATRLGVTERSLYRHLNGLKALGLIEALPQERKSRNGRYAVARLRLTRKAAELVGLIDQNFNVIHTSPYDNLSDRHTVSVPTVSKYQRQPAHSGALPSDLAHLTGQGLSKAGLFKLMGMAKANGKLLSDIVAASRQRLTDLSGGKLYSYLAALASGPSDFSVAAALARKRAADAHIAAQLQQRVARFKARFAGAVLASKSGDALYRIDRGARFVETLQHGRSGTAPLNDLEPWIAAVDRGHLVLATAAVERRFGLLV